MIAKQAQDAVNNVTQAKIMIDNLDEENKIQTKDIYGLRSSE